MGRYFGTDGFRGEANENLTADPRLQNRQISWLVVTQRENEKNGIKERSSDSYRKGYKTFGLYV